MSPKVVVIEDDRDLAGLLRYAFEHDGFEFAGTHDGLTAPEFCLREQPDAIVLDVMLLGMDGFSVCKQLRADIGGRTDSMAVESPGGLYRANPGPGQLGESPPREIRSGRTLGNHDHPVKTDLACRARPIGPNAWRDRCFIRGK